jgi:hypothetical protein
MAKVTLRFDDWKVVRVAPTTGEIPVVAPKAAARP